VESDAATSGNIAELRKHLASIAGREINASDEQLLQLFFRVSLYSYEDGTIMSRPITYFGQSCAQASTIQASFLDVSSSSSTNNSGRSEFLLTDFICSTENIFAAPVSLVVTPYTRTACYATMTHTLVPEPNSSLYNDLQIVVSTWSAQGQPAPGISFDWRCRLLSLTLVG
jgi:hypothetical protein